MKVFQVSYIINETKNYIKQLSYGQQNHYPAHQHNKLIQLETSMLMYGIYNAEV